MKRKTGLANNDAEVNMTPMLDIVFIMLIFFIVSSTFIQEDGLDLSDEKNSKKNQEDSTPIKSVLVQLCHDDTILLNKRPIDIRSVRANIERQIAEHTKLVVLVESEPGSSTDSLVKVVDQTRSTQAGLSVSSNTSDCNNSNSSTHT